MFKWKAIFLWKLAFTAYFSRQRGYSLVELSWIVVIAIEICAQKSLIWAVVAVINGAEVEYIYPNFSQEGWKKVNCTFQCADFGMFQRRQRGLNSRRGGYETDAIQSWLRRKRWEKGCDRWTILSTDTYVTKRMPIRDIVLTFVITIKSKTILHGSLSRFNFRHI